LGDAGKAAALDVWPLAGHERLQVHAGAEPLAAAGEHAHAEARVGVELVERGGDPVRHRSVDRVALVGPVDRDQEDPSAALAQDWIVFSAHAANNLKSGSR